MHNVLTVIGCGKVGQALARLWTVNRTFLVREILNRTEESSRAAAAWIGAGQAVADFASLQPADIYLIAAPDGQIVPCCEQLAQTGRLSSASIVFHCSGALPSSVLSPASRLGAAVASVHPIRSFAVPEQVVKNFAGTWCGVEGDQRALDVLMPAFAAIGAQLVPVKTEAKIHYHAAAVFASNYLVTLLDVARQSYAQAGIGSETALQLMAPLVRETVENVLRLGPEAALTGPIARGDWTTANQQWQAVAAADPAHGALYKEFMQLTADLAARCRPQSK